MSVYGWNSYAQYALHGHGVATVAPIVEESTGAIPLTIVIGRGMNIILAAEFGLKASKLDAIGFFRVTLGFRNLTDHT